MRNIVIAAVLCVVLVGCGESGPVKPSKHITMENFADGPWPFTFWGGNIKCQEKEGLALKSEKGRIYALNGSGIGLDLMGSGVWKDSPNINGAKISIAPVIKHAREACGY